MRGCWSAPWRPAVVLAVIALVGQSENESGSEKRRVMFPQGYRNKYQVLCRFEKADKKQVVTVYGNSSAASVSNVTQLPYPYGSMIVMETADVMIDSQGNIVLEKGRYREGKVVGLHVMGKERGFGAGYQQDRTGEWEYVEYRPDGSYITPPEKSAVCAQCHLKAGRERDFVYGGRFHSDGGK